MCNFSNSFVAVEEWRRGDPSPKLTTDPTSEPCFWLCIDPPRRGQVALGELAPSQWAHAYFCQVFPRPSPSTTQNRPTEKKEACKYSTDVGSTLLYGDNRVNVWDFQVEPQTGCIYHVHRFPYLFINLVEGSTQATDVQGRIMQEESIRHHTAGQMTFVDVDAESELPNHAFQNVATTKFCQYIIEFK
ncbi:hypothetical protein LEN26_018169 [Aphanomyces euteiches]|nr:hypothetical protein LEN26_018169 [Aphanomyces euteiches]KAH9122231.1 hypothetical protein AeMF1_006382 [Aphanomyces euteiches]KAH9184366.1 hypothetical protein AeNC1_013655 [Aphanomyces euteiches]